MEAPRHSRLRWWIVGLLFLATVINYLDRQTLSILGTTLRQELRLTDRDYANCVSAFLFSYAIMYSVSGVVIDRVGVRLGAAVCVVWWSVAAMLTGLARGPLSLAAFRFLLGVGEPGIYPAGMKAAGEWFPGKLRGTAIGIFSSGSSVGAIVAAPVIAWMTLHFGWRAAFILPGLVGLVVWLPLWLAFYRAPVAVEVGAEDAPVVRRRWPELLTARKVWALLLGRVAADPVWYLYLFWLPDYLQRVRHLSLVEIGMYAWIPFLFADFGSILGGWLSDRLVRGGWPMARARFAVLAGIAALAPAGALVGFVHSTGVAMAITCLIAFLCQAWSINMGALVPDLMPKNETASVMGLLGTAGSCGGVVFSQFLAVMIAWFGYSSTFVLAAVLHPLSLLMLYLFLRPTLRAARTPQTTALRE